MESDAQQIARRLVLERFVLGTLEEDARAVLRARVIADPNVFAEVREIELDLLDVAAREALAAERLFAVEPERRPASGADDRSGTGMDAGLRIGRGAGIGTGIGAETGVGTGAQAGAARASHAIAATPYAGHVSAALAARALLDEVPPRAGDHRRRMASRPVSAARVRLWPAALWLIVAVLATSFPSTARRSVPTANTNGAAPDPHVAAPFVSGATTTAPDTTGVPAPVPIPVPAPAAGAPAAAAPPFLRIDLTFAGDRLGAHVTSPSGMFPGVWSLEIDNGPRGTRPPAGQTNPVPGREP